MGKPVAREEFIFQTEILEKSETKKVGVDNTARSYSRNS